MKVVIFGQGRIGLPISLVCAESGFKVTGIDVNKRLLESLKKQEIAFDEKGMKELLVKHLNKNYTPKHQKEGIENEVKEAEYIMLAVGTGFAKYPEKPKLDVLYNIIDQLIKIGIKNKTLILRVTLPIGTSDTIKNKIEQQTQLEEGKDFYFGFVPERIMEGKAITEEKSLPKIIGTYNDQGFEKVSNFFKKIGGQIVRVSNPKTAEFIKLIDNSWRNTRFAFANELAFLADNNNIDVIEAINSANSGYERNHIPKPGPVSGYCLGKDPYLLELAFSEIEKQRGFGSMWFYGRRANDWLNKKIIEEIQGKKVMIAGLSFKENIDDYRYSHAIDIIKTLIQKNYQVIVCDPFLDKNYYTTLTEDVEQNVEKYKDFKEATKTKPDTIIIATRHNEFTKINLDKDLKTEKTVKIIDLWNILEKPKNQKIIYKGFGRGK